jgi:hypothetical protein
MEEQMPEKIEEKAELVWLTTVVSENYNPPLITLVTAMS